MTIDEALKIIKDGRIVATAIKGNNEDDTKFNTDNIEALNVIIDTMRKYQKIEQIVEAWRADSDIDSDDSMTDIERCINGSDKRL